jgi:hypothetical protein
MGLVSSDEGEDMSLNEDTIGIPDVAKSETAEWSSNESTSVQIASASRRKAEVRTKQPVILLLTGLLRLMTTVQVPGEPGSITRIDRRTGRGSAAQPRHWQRSRGIGSFPGL